jgi:hypothetical protein
VAKLLTHLELVVKEEKNMKKNISEWNLRYDHKYLLNVSQVCKAADVIRYESDQKGESAISSRCSQH